MVSNGTNSRANGWPTNFQDSSVSTSYLPVGALALQTYAINSGFMRILGIWPRTFILAQQLLFPTEPPHQPGMLLLPYLFVHGPLHYQDVQQASQLGQVTFCPQILIGNTDGQLTSDLFHKQVFLTLKVESTLHSYTEFFRVLCWFCCDMTLAYARDSV